MSQAEIKEKNTGKAWTVEKMCTDVKDYELSVEKQKTNWECEQRRESWKWVVSYHGSIVSSGSVSTPDEAMQKAYENVPISEKD